ncbi:MAG: ROK family protein, partial [Pleurocapsa sp. SU_196_0]|nr:ROK family protein [Pleurocapsa sp. SU_196_0]
DAAAWGEYALGAGCGTKDFAFVTVSTGVGGGIVLNERLHTTSHGVHAELGYTLTPNGQPLELVAVAAHWIAGRENAAGTALETS